MRMSTLSNRLQVLIDDDRLARITAGAKENGVSVGEFVRRALDDALSLDSRQARQRDFLEMVKNTEPIDFGSIDDIRDELEKSSVREIFREER